MTVAQISPHGVAALMSVLPAGAGDFESGTVKVMALDNTTTIDANWEDIVALDNGGAYVLGEYRGSNSQYRRLDVSSSVVITVSGANVNFSLNTPIVWTAMLALLSGTHLRHFMFYVELDGSIAETNSTNPLDNRVPLCLLELSTNFIPDGTDFTVTQPTDGFFSIRTDGC